MLERLEQLAREAERMPWEKDASDVPYSVRAAFHDGITPEDVLKLIAALKAAQTVDKMHGSTNSHEFRAIRDALVELERE